MKGYDRSRHGDLAHVNRRQGWRRRVARFRAWLRGLGAIRLPAFGDQQ